MQRGFVKREEDPRDRRSKLVTVTARGRSTYERLTAADLPGSAASWRTSSQRNSEALADALAPVVRRLGP